MPIHNFSVWRVKPEDGYALWAKCRCGRWEGWARSYEDLSIMCEEHRKDAEALEELEREEAAHS